MTKYLNLKYLLTVKLIHEFSVTNPQHPMNAMKNITAPKPIKKSGAYKYCSLTNGL